MRRAAVALFVTCALLGVLRAQDARDPRSIEPPLEYELEVSGKRVQVDVDKPFDLPEGASGKAVLRLRPTRQFERSQVRFRYPRAYGFEADLSDRSVASYTLAGKDHSILLWVYEGAKDPKILREAYVDHVASRFGPKNIDLSEIELALAGKKREGLAVDIKSDANRLRQEIYAFPNGTTSILVVFQDRPQGEGKPSAEGKEAMDVFRATFELLGG